MNVTKIQFQSIQGDPIWIVADKITGAKKKDEEQTYIFVQAGKECEYWVVGENIDDVLRKI